MNGTAALLRGADHPTLGEREVVALDDATAVGISAGRLPKPYWHLDPNEDAVMAVAGAGWRLLAVADGHNGADASHAAVAAVAEAAGAAGARGVGDAGARDETSDGEFRPTSMLEVAADAAASAVEAAVRTAGEGHGGSRTALSIAVLGGTRVATLTWGDTAVLLVRMGRRPKATLLSPTAPFLGPGVPQPMPGAWAVEPGDRLVVCSDGVSDYLGGRWKDRVAEAAEGTVRAEQLVEALLEQASAGGSGDHQAVAVTIV